MDLIIDGDNNIIARSLARTVTGPGNGISTGSSSTNSSASCHSPRLTRYDAVILSITRSIRLIFNAYLVKLLNYGTAFAFTSELDSGRRGGEGGVDEDRSRNGFSSVAEPL